MQFRRRLLTLAFSALAVCAPSFAGPVIIDFAGTASDGGHPLSHYWLLYYGSDSTDAGTGHSFAPLSATNCNAGTCDISATLFVSFPPLSPVGPSWAPTTSAYTIVGFYDGGPGVFVLNATGVTPTDFLTQFNYNESTIANDISQGWTNPGGFADTFSFVLNNLASFPSITLGGATSSGTIYDYTSPEANGSITLQATVEGAGGGGGGTDMPEPATMSMMAGALGLAAFARRRRP